MTYYLTVSKSYPFLFKGFQQENHLCWKENMLGMYLFSYLRKTESFKWTFTQMHNYPTSPSLIDYYWFRCYAMLAMQYYTMAS